MVNPRSLVFQLHKYWDVVETLCRASREQPTFNESQVLRAVAKSMPSVAPDEQQAVVRSLVNAGIMEVVPRSDDFQVNSLVLDFVRGTG